MNSNVVYVVSLAIVLNCVISVAKNSEENVIKPSLNNAKDHSLSQLPTPEIFAEGISNANTTPQRRIVGRKGAIPESNSEATITANATQSANITSTIPTTTTTTQPSTTTIKAHSKISTKVVTSTTVKTITSTTTKKPVLKPKVTYSADDNADILASEKNINYNATVKVEDNDVPKIADDIDRTMIDDENRTRNSYIFFMGILFGIPMTFTLIHVLYKKIKAWREIRHYQRVVSYCKVSHCHHKLIIFLSFQGLSHRRDVHQLRQAKTSCRTNKKKILRRKVPSSAPNSMNFSPILVILFR